MSVSSLAAGIAEPRLQAVNVECGKRMSCLSCLSDVSPQVEEFQRGEGGSPGVP